MLAAVFRGPGALEVAEVETPEAGAGEVLVEVGANTVCGTDVRVVSGEKARGVAPDVVLGHEFAGRVAAVGRGVEGFEVGASAALAPALVCRMCRYCHCGMGNLCPHKRLVGLALDGGLAEYACIPAEAVAAGNLFLAQEGVPFEHLALAEPLACCIDGQENYGVEQGGHGPDPGRRPHRALPPPARATSRGANRDRQRPGGPAPGSGQELGATVTVDPASESLGTAVDEWTEEFGVDVAVVCAGVPDLVNEAIWLVRKGGRVSAFAGFGGDGWATVEANLIHYNEISVTGASDCRLDQYERALRLIESGGINVGGMLTHRFPLAAAAEAIETSAKASGIKVAVVP